MITDFVFCTKKEGNASPLWNLNHNNKIVKLESNVHMFTVIFRCVTVDFLLPLVIFKVLFPALIKYQSHHTVISLKHLHFRAVFLIIPWVIFKLTYMATTYTHKDMRRKKSLQPLDFLDVSCQISEEKKWVWLVSSSCCCMFASIKVCF